MVGIVAALAIVGLAAFALMGGFATGDPVPDVTGKTVEEVEAKVRALQQNCVGASRAGANGAKAKLEYALESVRGGTTVIIGHARHHLSDLVQGRVPCTRIGVE